MCFPVETKEETHFINVIAFYKTQGKVIALVFFVPK